MLRLSLHDGGHGARTSVAVIRKRAGISKAGCQDRGACRTPRRSGRGCPAAIPQVFSAANPTRRCAAARRGSSPGSGSAAPAPGCRPPPRKAARPSSRRRPRRPAPGRRIAMRRAWGGRRGAAGPYRSSMGPSRPSGSSRTTLRRARPSAPGLRTGCAPEEIGLLVRSAARSGSREELRPLQGQGADATRGDHERR